MMMEEGGCRPIVGESSRTMCMRAGVEEEMMNVVEAAAIATITFILSAL